MSIKPSVAPATAYSFGPELRHIANAGTLSEVRSGWFAFVDEKALYGYYEHDEQGGGGGLWFERLPESDLFKLVDFDGRADLPLNVVNALRVAGYVVDDDFIGGR